MKFVAGLILFVIAWTLAGITMERAGVEDGAYYMAAGTLWGVAWVAFCFGCDD